MSVKKWGSKRIFFINAKLRSRVQPQVKLSYRFVSTQCVAFNIAILIIASHYYHSCARIFVKIFHSFCQQYSILIFDNPSYHGIVYASLFVLLQNRIKNIFNLLIEASRVCYHRNLYRNNKSVLCCICVNLCVEPPLLLEAMWPDSTYQF